MNPFPTVLIVDDSSSIRHLLRSILNRAGYATLEAADGGSALLLAARHHPDLVMLDIDLPVLDGFQVCRRLRRSPEFDGTRVIMLTACTNPVDEAQAHAAGVDAFLSKPFRVTALLEAIRNLLGDRAPGASTRCTAG